MTAEIRDPNGLFGVGNTIGYIEDGSVVGAGGLLGSGEIVTLDGTQVREVGGLFSTDQAIATVDDEKVVEAGGWLETTETLAVIDGNKIRDGHGGILGRGDVLAVIDGSATTEEKGAAAAAITLNYIEQEQSTLDIAAGMAGTAAQSQSQPQATRSGDSFFGANSSLGKRLLTVFMAFGILTFASIPEGLSQGNFAVVAVFFFWGSAGLWYFKREWIDKGDGSSPDTTDRSARSAEGQREASDETVTGDPRGMETEQPIPTGEVVDIDIDMRAVDQKLESDTTLSPAEAAAFVPTIEDDDLRVQAGAVRILGETAAVSSADAIREHYTGEDPDLFDAMEMFHRIVVGDGPAALREDAAWALFQFMHSYPLWLSAEREEQLLDAAERSLDNPVVVNNCFGVIALKIAMRPGRATVDRSWFTQFESHHDSEIRESAVAAKQLIDNGGPEDSYADFS